MALKPSNLLVKNVFGLDLTSRIGGSIHSYIYDVIKIFILLSVLIFVISYIQGISANILGALLGTVTQFCSCSSIPLFIGFTRLGTTLSFMMAVTALSLPSMILLKNVVKTRLLATFVGLVTVGVIIIGYAFNAYGYLFL